MRGTSGTDLHERRQVVERLHLRPADDLRPRRLLQSPQQDADRFAAGREHQAAKAERRIGAAQGQIGERLAWPRWRAVASEAAVGSLGSVELPVPSKLNRLPVALAAAVEHQGVLQAPFDAELLVVVQRDFGQHDLNHDHRRPAVERLDDPRDLVEISLAWR